MAIKRKKDDDEEKEEKQEAEELVTDMDAVKDAIQACLDFEKEKKIRLINPRGKRQFSEMYRKKEPERKIEQIIDNRIDIKMNQQLTPLNKKIDILLKLVKDKEEEEDEKPKKKQQEQPDDIEDMKQKIDSL